MMYQHSRTFSSEMPGLPNFKTLLETINSSDSMLWPSALDSGHCLSGGTCHEMGDVFCNDLTHLDSFHDVWGLSRQDEERFSSVNSTLEMEMKRKICEACAKLDIISDPSKWTIDEVHRWLRWTMKQFNSSPSAICPHNWFVNGSLLCTMTIQDFEARLPQEGEILFAELEMWKSAHASGFTQCETKSSVSTNTSDHVIDSPDSVPSYAILESMEALKHLPPLLSIHDEQFSPSSSMSISPPERYHTYTESLVHQGDPRWESSPFLGNAPSYVKLEACLSSCNIDDSASADSWTHSPVTSSTSALCRDPGDQKNYNRKWMLDSAHNMADNMALLTSTRRKRTICLWQFLKELLLMPNSYQSWIRWLDRNRGIFKIEDSVQVAKLWGVRKNRPAMNYDKLSRSIRQYYKKGIIQKTTQSKRLVYQFCPAYMN